MGVNKLTQKLANSLSQEQRDEAIEQVMNYICSKKEISFIDLQKLWQGLYYCYWLADKQIYQDDVANIYSGALNKVQNTEIAFIYLQTFYETLMKNWKNLDKHRIAKYMTLIRKFTGETIELIKSKNYDLGLIEKINEILLKGPLNVDILLVEAIRIFMFEIILEEIQKHAEEITQDALIALLKPYFICFVRTTNQGLERRAKEEFLEKLLAYNSEDESESQLPTFIDYQKVSKVFEELEKTEKG